MTPCDWAACRRPAAHRLDGWWHCKKHTSEHLELFPNATPPPPPKPIRIVATGSDFEKARQILTAFQGATPDLEFFGTSKQRDLAWARQEAMVAIRQQTALSLNQIGELFRRDHTTVIHAFRAVQRRQAASA